MDMLTAVPSISEKMSQKGFSEPIGLQSTDGSILICRMLIRPVRVLRRVMPNPNRLSSVHVRKFIQHVI